MEKDRQFRLKNPNQKEEMTIESTLHIPTPVEKKPEFPLLAQANEGRHVVLFNSTHTELSLLGVFTR